MTKCTAITIAAIIGLIAAPAQADLLYRAGDWNESLDYIDTDTFNIDQSVPLDSGVLSLATQPGTNTLFGITYSTRGPANGLVTIDPATGAFDFVVDMQDPIDPTPYFSTITFKPDGSLYTVATPDCGWTPGAILEVDTGTGVLTDTGLTYGGVGGQAIEFNPDDGLFYHFYNDDSGGGGNSFLETVDPVSGTVTPVGLTGYDFHAVNAVVYAGAGKFYAYDAASGAGDLLEITTEGEVTWLHNYGDNGAHGLALPVYVPEPATLSLLALGGLALLRWRR
ncbi:MAG: PEP-CTERM sorting domain-containing protein [Phycisphaerae bacterium]|nr:PEP-CTERM sorting domain-containing protein [Phycisphaerae bacterium]